MLARIASTPGAVGYVSFDVLNDTVHALSLDGVEAAAEMVKTGVIMQMNWILRGPCWRGSHPHPALWDMSLSMY